MRRRSTRGLAAAPAIAGLVILTACSPASMPTTSAPASGGDTLAGTTWILQTIGGTAPPAGINVTLALTADQVSGTSGCNQYGGSYTANGGSISVGPLAATEMACPEPQMAVEAAYLAALGAATTWAIPADAVGTELTLASPDPAQTLVFGPGA